MCFCKTSMERGVISQRSLVLDREMSIEVTNLQDNTGRCKRTSSWVLW